MLLFFVVVTGFASPIVMMWVVMVAMADVFFSKNGFYIALLAFLLTAGASINRYELVDQVTVVMSALYVAGLAVFVYGVRRATYKNHVDLAQTKQRHALRGDH